MSDVEAGEGDAKPYYIVGTGSDQRPLTREVDYLSVEAASWFVNKQGDWFHDRQAAGTLTITLGDGAESYNVSLGLYELASGARYAPVFNQPVLSGRAYKGGTVSIKAVVHGVSKDTGLMTLIKSTTSAALGVASTMVQTATATGPYAPLGKIGATLVEGVGQLFTSADLSMELFDPNEGMQFNFPPGAILGPESYLLLHRGAPLDSRNITIGTDTGTVPYYNNALLIDGVWLLLRLRRTDSYPDEREWQTTYRKWYTDLVDLMDDLQLNAVDKAKAAALLAPGTDEKNPTLYDRYRQLRSTIAADGALTETEARNWDAALVKYLVLADNAATSGDTTVFFNAIATQARSADSGKHAADSVSVRPPAASPGTPVRTAAAATLVRTPPKLLDILGARGPVDG